MIASTFSRSLTLPINASITKRQVLNYFILERLDSRDEPEEQQEYVQ